MAKFYQMEEYNLANRKTCFDKVQLDVLKHVLASQLCRMDDPQYGYMILSAMPTTEDDEWVMRASMCSGDFCLSGMKGETLARQSISAAVNFPDTDLHYAQMVPGGDQLWGNAYFDEALSVLVLAANGGQLMLALQIAHTEDGDEYAREHLLKAYAAATLVFR